MKAPLRLTPALLRKSYVHLRQSDPIMADLIGKHGPCSLAHSPFEPFHILTASIISQQLSAKAANTIERRIAQLAPSPFQPKDLLRVPASRLREAGLSCRKAGYIHELAKHIADERLSFDALDAADNDAVVAALIELPGIGQWTAEMFLIFGLKRPDVLSLADAALQRAVRLLYGPSKQLHLIARHWQPYASIASWYLWRHLDAGAKKDQSGSENDPS